MVFENKDETLMQDVFITNLINPEKQKELLKETIEPWIARTGNKHWNGNQKLAADTSSKQHFELEKRECS